MELHDLIGIIGVICIIAAYGSLQLDFVSGDSLSYLLLNLIGALLVLVSLYFEWNLSAAVMEGIWVLISCYGLGKHVFASAPVDSKPKP